MSEIRTVNIFLNSVQIAEAIEATDREKFYRAVGYLCTWNPTFPIVDILSDREKTDLVAVYRSNDGKIGYTIGAVWHDDHYGMHS
jgi:hypothetical protein